MSDDIMSEGKRIVVTGVSRGLGRAMVEGFIEAGSIVAGCARTADAVEKLGATWPSPHRFDAVDVRSDEEVGRWAASVLADGEPPDLLVNNAAVVNRNAALWDVPEREFSDVFDINVKGVVNVIRHFAPAMIERGRGVIVNFSSGWGRVTSAEVAPYCGSKFAIEGLTGAMAQELPPGMAAVPLNPGVINTDMLQSCFGAAAAGYEDAEAWARRAVPFILALGPEHNGQSLTVD